MIDPTTLSLLAVGLKIANESYKLYGQVQGRQKQQAIETQVLRGLIASSTSSLQDAISHGADRVIEKIEQGKMEELAAHLQNLDFLLKMKKDDHILNCLMQVRASVSYAQNRLNEGKKPWFIPVVTGKAMMAATFTYLGDEDPELTLELERLTKETKKQILNEVTLALIEAGQELPWDLIGDVLNGQEGAVEEFVGMLPTVSNQEQQSKTVLTPPTNQIALNLSSHQREFWEHSNARLLIEDVFVIGGRGTVVTGMIAAGRFCVGDVVSIVSQGQEIDTIVTGIEMFRKLCDEGREGDNVGMLLKGVKRAEVNKGDILVKLF